MALTNHFKILLDHALTPKVVETDYNLSCFNKDAYSGPRKLSLQEAFEMNRYDLISRSRQRQKEIRMRTEVRQQEQEYEIERMAELQKRLELTTQMHVNQRHHDLTKKKQLSKSNSKCYNQLSTEMLNSRYQQHQQQQPKSTYFEIGVENFHHKRAMSSQEIKNQTRKNYSKLPEVKQKQLKLRAEEIKRRNRLKSDIYKKVRDICSCVSFNFN